jgi:ABC-2 type transport system permease protein
LRNFLRIFKKEMAAYFISPVAYVVIILFIILMGFFFCFFLASYTQMYNQYQMMLAQAQQNPIAAWQLQQIPPPNFNQDVMRPFYFWLSFIMLFVLPMLTMRLFSEEKRSGTLELLLTYPVRDGQIVLGKFLACLVVFAIMLALTLVFPLFVNLTTEKATLETGPLALTYAGSLLVGGAFIAIGMFLSTLTKNQIIAAVLTFGVLFGFFFLWLLGFSVDQLSQYFSLFRIEEFVEFFKHLSIFGHNENFIRGLLDTRDLLYCFNFTLGSLFLCWVSLGMRKWRS